MLNTLVLAITPVDPMVLVTGAAIGPKPIGVVVMLLGAMPGIIGMGHLAHRLVTVGIHRLVIPVVIHAQPRQVIQVIFIPTVRAVIFILVGNRAVVHVPAMIHIHVRRMQHVHMTQVP